MELGPGHTTVPTALESMSSTLALGDSTCRGVRRVVMCSQCGHFPGLLVTLGP